MKINLRSIASFFLTLVMGAALLMLIISFSSCTKASAEKNAKTTTSFYPVVWQDSTGKVMYFTKAIAHVTTTIRVVAIPEGSTDRVKKLMTVYRLELIASDSLGKSIYLSIDSDTKIEAQKPWCMLQTGYGYTTYPAFYKQDGNVYSNFNLTGSITQYDGNTVSIAFDGAFQEPQTKKFVRVVNFIARNIPISSN